MTDFDHVGSRDVDQPPGACFVVGRAEYLELGGLDEGLVLFFNDVDFCRRLDRGGRRIRYVADAEVLHLGGASTRGFEKFIVVWHRNRIAYYRKRYGRWVLPYLRLVTRMRAVEEWIRVGLRNADKAARRSEREHLRDALREILQSAEARA